VGAGFAARVAICKSVIRVVLSVAQALPVSLIGHSGSCVALAVQRHLPALYGFSTAVQQGGLMSYSANFFAMWRRATGYVDRILKGEHPADLPIEQATEVAIDINLKTAKVLGLKIPSTLLTAADEVIE